MDIAALSTQLSSASLSNQVGISVLKKAMDTQTAQSTEMIQLMEQSVMPHIGQNLDLKI